MAATRKPRENADVVDCRAARKACGEGWKAPKGRRTGPKGCLRAANISENVINAFFGWKGGEEFDFSSVTKDNIKKIVAELGINYWSVVATDKDYQKDDARWYPRNESAKEKSGDAAKASQVATSGTRVSPGALASLATESEMREPPQTPEMSDGGSSPRRFAVALSFAGEEREVVKKVAIALSETFGKSRVFYDEWHNGEFAGHDSDLLLQKVFGAQADVVVPFYSGAYVKKNWTRTESRKIRELLFKQNSDRVLPLKFGSPEIPGACAQDIIFDVTGWTAEKIAKLIVERYQKLFGILSKPNETKSSHQSELSSIEAPAPATTTSSKPRDERDDKEKGNLDYLRRVEEDIVEILSRSETSMQILFNEYKKHKKDDDIERHVFVASQIVENSEHAAYVLKDKFDSMRRVDPAACKVIAQVAKHVAPMLVPDSVLDIIDAHVASKESYFIAIDVETAAGAEAALAKRDGRPAGLRDRKRPADMPLMSGQHQIREVGESGALGFRQFIEDFEEGLFYALGLSPTELKFAYERKKNKAKDKLKMREKYPKFGRVYYIIREMAPPNDALEYIKENWPEIIIVRIGREDSESSESYWENAPLAALIELLIVADESSP